jgi:hypothetical protein
MHMMGLGNVPDPPCNPQDSVQAFAALDTVAEWCAAQLKGQAPALPANPPPTDPAAEHPARVRTLDSILQDHGQGIMEVLVCPPNTTIPTRGGPGPNGGMRIAGAENVRNIIDQQRAVLNAVKQARETGAVDALSKVEEAIRQQRELGSDAAPAQPAPPVPASNSGGATAPETRESLCKAETASESTNTEIGRIVFELNHPPNGSHAMADDIVEVPNPFDEARRLWLPILKACISRIPELAGDLTEEKLRQYLWLTFKVPPTIDLHAEQLVSLLEREQSRVISDHSSQMPTEAASVNQTSEVKAPSPQMPNSLKKRKEPSKDAIAVYRYWMATGKKQKVLADDPGLMNVLRRKVDQGTISRMLKQVKEWIQAGNVLPGLSEPLNSKPTPMDPERIDLGANKEHRPERQRQRRDSGSED